MPFGYQLVNGRPHDLDMFKGFTRRSSSDLYHSRGHLCGVRVADICCASRVRPNCQIAFLLLTALRPVFLVPIAALIRYSVSVSADHREL